MYKLWCLLIYGYIPKWKILNQYPLKKSGSSGIAVGQIFEMQCEKTGRVKVKTCNY